MKIILANLHFWPDTPPNALMLKYIAEALSKDGNDVSVVTTQPCYKKDYKIKLQPKNTRTDSGYKINRINLGLENTGNILNKLKVYFGYSLFLFYKILKEKPERTIVTTTPTILGVLATRIASSITGGSYIYHCQDLHPEFASINGDISDGMFYKLLLHIEKENTKKAFKAIVLSDDMKQSLLRRGCDKTNIEVINNFELRPIIDKKSLTNQVSKPLLRDNKKFRVLFAGNIGRFQGLETIIETAHILADTPEIEFVFLGEGIELEKLKKQADSLLNSTVKFISHQPIEIARKVIADSQLCVISLNKDVYKYAFPSKTMTYLCEGAPLLALVERRSSLAKVILKEKIGAVFNHSEPEKIARYLSTLYKDKKTLCKMKENALRYANEHYKVEAVLPLFVKAFTEK